METKYITDLILNCRFVEKKRVLSRVLSNDRYHEACKEVVEKELEMQTLYPSKHQHWRHVMRAELRALTPSSKLDYQTNIAFYLCLSTCFEHLNDEPSKVWHDFHTLADNLHTLQLAAQYQVVVNMFKSNSHLYEKVELLTKFGGECVENGYLQQAIMVCFNTLCISLTKISSCRHMKRYELNRSIWLWF